MKLIANRQLYGEYGTVVAGQEFEASDQVGLQLLQSGVVRRPDPPRVTYETKVIVPTASEVSARQPFRHLPVSDPESPNMAAEGDRVLSAADLPAVRNDDPGRRSGRRRPSTG